MKSIEEIRKAISKIRILDLNREDVYSIIEQLIKNDIIQFALPSKVFSPGLKLHRCRNNEHNGEFTTIDELSFRKDLENIKYFGRANMPKQSVFYAADVRPTAIAETSKAFRGENYTNLNEISITTGHWESIDYLKLTLIVGNKAAQEKNELIKHYNINIEKLSEDLFNEESYKVLEILNFISDEFAYNTKENSSLYKISCAFAQFAFQTSDGIIYPSLQRNFEGLNFAIKPDSIKKLKFVSATHDVFKKVEEKGYEHFETRETIGSLENKLIWGDSIQYSKV